MSQQIYFSPVICYEVTKENSSFGIDVYYKEYGKSLDNQLCCSIRDFSATEEKAKEFAQFLAHSCALPIHVPELAEEFLSL